MPSLTALKAAFKTLAIDFSGVVLALTYDPNVITPRLEEEMKDAAANGDSTIKKFLDTLTKTIVTWDMTDDEGVPAPITVEYLMDTPDAVLSKISAAILGDMRPNPTNS